MRPFDYKNHLLDLFSTSGDVDCAEDLKSNVFPYGFSILVDGAERHWQVYGQLAEGSKHETETPPVHGGPMLPYNAEYSRAGSPAWMSALIGTSRPTDVQSVEVWPWDSLSQRCGLTVFFRNGEKIFIRMITEEEKL